ncbi:methyltransferase, partial [Xanthomonas citri pv. citri]|nr:methyltransferase [Xanthomonas citri pv. citri]
AFRASEQQEIIILDFGCGKSYLTFILYYYFTVKRGVKATILGYDLKEDVVEHCNAIAQKSGYDGLRFVVSDVTRDTLADTRVDMVVTLHAC